MLVDGAFFGRNVICTFQYFIHIAVILDKNTPFLVFRQIHVFDEPMTVHESSLSPHIHSILAARIGKVEKAYQLFLHATRLDLNDYNNEADQGLHITSMPGSWLAIVRGFAGMQVLKETLCFSPVIPQKWDSYSFKVNYLKNTLHIRLIELEIAADGFRVEIEIEISLTAGSKVDIQVYGHPYTLERGTELKINMPMCK